MTVEATIIQHARPNEFEIDLTAIAGFTRHLRQHVGADVRLFATLKCNAYGFGLIPVARTVLGAGADALSMVDQGDAIRLREAGLTAPILVYPGAIIEERYVRAAEKYDLISTITSLAAAEEFSRHARQPLQVAVKLDVGQERLGILAEEAPSALLAISQMPNIRIQVINAHPNVPASCSIEYLEWQLGRFEKACKAAEAAGIHIPIRMLASSKILSMTNRLVLNAVDPGQMYFGPLQVAGDVPWPTNRQAFKKLKTRVIHIRALDRSAFQEMAPFPSRPGMKMGIVPIGSADGAAQLHCGEVLVRGRRAKVIGKPSLEHMRIDLSEIPESEVGDEVVIIGQQQGATISPEEVVAFQGHVRVADLAIAVRPQIPRVYVNGR